MGYDVTYFTVHMARGALKLRLFFDHGLDSAEKYSSKIQTLTLTAHKKPGPRRNAIFASIDQNKSTL